MLLASLLGRVTPGMPVSQTPGVLFGERTSSAGVTAGPEDALSLSAVFAGVNLLARVQATLPLKVYRQSGRDRLPASDHPAHRLLSSQANPEMTAAVARRTLEFHRLLWGNGYAEIGWRGDGMPAALWPIEPWRVKPRRKDDGTLYYRIDDSRDVAAADMIHHTLVSYDGITGRSWVDYALESLGIGLASQQFAAAYFGNGGRPGVILSHPSSQTPEQVGKMRKGWSERHQGAGKAGGVAVMTGGWTYQPDGSSDPQQMQLIDVRRFGIEDTARWLNIPPHLLRELARSTNNNIEHQGIDFVVYSIGPTLVEEEQEYDRKLLGGSDSLWCKHNVAGLLRGDSTARGNYYKGLFSVAAITPNEIRDLEEMNPIEGGDEPFSPVNMQPLSRAMQGPEPTPQETPAPVVPEDPAPEPGLSAAKVAEGMRAVLASTLDRMARVEAHAVQRLAGKGAAGFLDGVDALLGKHRETLAEAVAPVLAAAEVAGLVIEAQAERLAEVWCIGSRIALLDVADHAKPATLAGLVDRWAGANCYGKDMAERWIGGAA